MAWSLLKGSDVNVSLYQAAAALDANSRWQEVIADNLASSSVPGYKQQQLSLAAVQAGLMPALGERNLPQYFHRSQGEHDDQFHAGEMKYTGDNTNAAIEGKGFFEVQLPNGTTAADARRRVSSQFARPIGDQRRPTRCWGRAGRSRLNRDNPEPISISATGDVTQGAELKRET